MLVSKLPKLQNYQNGAVSNPHWGGGGGFVGGERDSVDV
jgi:hypothetical protein